MPYPCIVALCKKYGNHIIPKDEPRRTQWMEAIEQKKPGFALRKQIRICSDHFMPTDFRRTPLSLFKPDSTQKTLNKTAVPSIFPWKSTRQHIPDVDTPKFNVSNSHITYAKLRPLTFVEEQPNINSMVSDLKKDPLNLVTEVPDSKEQAFWNVDIKEETADESEEVSCNADIKEDIAEETEISFDGTDGLQEHSIDNSIEKREISVQTDGCQCLGFSIHHYKMNRKAMHFYTGLETFDKVMLVFNTLGRCAYSLKYFDGNPPKDLDALEQFFITLTILRRRKSYEEIAILYNVSIKQIRNLFITWIRFMSLQWKKLDLWRDGETKKVFLNVTDLPIKKPTLPFAQRVTFSNKNRNTVKVLIGITPRGGISYVSSCYGGSATSKQIVEKSGIICKFNPNDEVIVEKGLNVQDIFSPYGVKVNQISDFKNGNQTLTLSRKVTSKLVENVIGLLKTYKILCHPLNNIESMISSDIVFVCAMLVNFKSSVLNT